MRSVGSRFSGSRSPQGWSSPWWRDFSFAAEIRRTLLLGKWSSLLSAFESRRFAEFPSRFRDIVDNSRCHWPNLFSRSSFSASSSAGTVGVSLRISPLALLPTENFGRLRGITRLSGATRPKRCEIISLFEREIQRHGRNEIPMVVANEILETCRVSLSARFSLSLSLGQTSTARARIRAEFSLENPRWILFFFSFSRVEIT